MGEWDDNGKHREKRETDLFANDPGDQPHDELDPFADLQHDYEALLNHAEPEANVSLHDMDKDLEAESAKPPVKPEPDQANAAELTDHAADHNSSKDTAATPPLTDNQAAEGAEKQQLHDGIDATESDDVDGYFAQFSEMANSADLPAETEAIDESLFDDIPPDPDAEKRTLDHPLWQQPEKTGNRRALATIFIILAIGLSGGAYWYTTASDQQIAQHSGKQTTAGEQTDKAVAEKEKAAIRTALAEKILADARVAKERKQVSGSTPASAKKPVAEETDTAQQLEQAKAQLALEKRNLAAAQGVADHTDRAAITPGTTTQPSRAEAAVEARQLADAKAAAESKRLADAKAAAEAKRMADAKAATEAKRMADAKAATEAKRIADAKAAAEAKRLADAKAAAEAKRLADAKAAAEAKRLADAKAAVAKPKANAVASSQPVVRQQVVVQSKQLPTRPHVVKKQHVVSTPAHAQQIIEYGALDDEITMTPAAAVITPITPVTVPATSGGIKPSTTSAQTGEWMIILTSASSDKSARQQVARMHEQGVQAEVARIVDQGRVFHRIRLTGFSSRQQAQQQLDIVSRKLGLHGAKIEKL